jgi:hypothetical protein
LVKRGNSKIYTPRNFPVFFLQVQLIRAATGDGLRAIIEIRSLHGSLDILNGREICACLHHRRARVHGPDRAPTNLIMTAIRRPPDGELGRSIERALGDRVSALANDRGSPFSRVGFIGFENEQPIIRRRLLAARLTLIRTGQRTDFRGEAFMAKTQAAPHTPSGQITCLKPAKIWK